MTGLLRWMFENRWLLFAVVLFVIILIRFFVRDHGPEHDDDDVGEPPPSGGVA